MLTRGWRLEIEVSSIPSKNSSIFRKMSELAASTFSMFQAAVNSHLAMVGQSMPRGDKTRSSFGKGRLLELFKEQLKKKGSWAKLIEETSLPKDPDESKKSLLAVTDLGGFLPYVPLKDLAQKLDSLPKASQRAIAEAAVAVLNCTPIGRGEEPSKVSNYVLEVVAAAPPIDLPKDGPYIDEKTRVLQTLWETAKPFFGSSVTANVLTLLSLLVSILALVMSLSAAPPPTANNYTFVAVVQPIDRTAEVIDKIRCAPESDRKYLRVTSKERLVRSTPRTNSRSVASLPAGSIVCIQYAVPDWTEISWLDGNATRSGWINTRYLEKIGPFPKRLTWR
ncbi:SH3 domain-containing protein [Achromobacter aegrifaciens]|uniref:SH3 domain-containing protein n=1 Tax=Achromobacter aegrifaciens TaxID=1287736 RepID=UPI003207FCBE